MNRIKFLLSPFSFIYWIVTSVRNTFFELGILKQYESKIPLISVGNLSLGGTGKTPHVAYISALLSDKKIAVISRGYGRKKSNLIVGDTRLHTSADIGDEPMELLSKFEGENFKMLIEGNRKKALQYIEEEFPNTKLVVLDDGFQHRYVKRNLNLLLTDFNNLFYKDFIVPVGNLRESRNGAKRADAIIVTKCSSSISLEAREQIKKQLARYINASVYFSKITYKGFKNEHGHKINTNKSYLVVTGIAKPSPIFNYLKKQNINFESLIFSDHHNFSSKDLQKIVLKSKKSNGIITTEKDWMRLKETKLKRLNTIEVYRLEIGITFVGEGETNRFEKHITETLN